MPKRVWKIAETKTGKIQVVKTKRKGEERGREKETRRKETEKRIKEIK